MSPTSRTTQPTGESATLAGPAFTTRPGAQQRDESALTGAGPVVTPREPMAHAQPHTLLAPGTVVGGYVVQSVLGGGGMGRVYLARDRTLDRPIALKVLPPEEADPEARARFLREGQALARVKHKNVVDVHACGNDGDVAWMALELIEGDLLSSLVIPGGIDEETALALCAQAARGLAAAHAHGVVHRDVKPENLILDKDATVRVLDFGVALVVDNATGGFLTQKGVAIGTPHYMAPEQARGGRVDGRCDAWGLGATLFTLLTGVPPFFRRAEEADLDILARIVRERAPDVMTKRANVHPGTAALVARMLEPDVAARLADLEEVAALLDAQADAVAHASADGPAYDVTADGLTQVNAHPHVDVTAALPTAPDAPVPDVATVAPVAAPQAASSGPSTATVLLALAGAIACAAIGAVIAIGLLPDRQPRTVVIQAAPQLEPAPAAPVAAAPAASTPVAQPVAADGDDAPFAGVADGGALAAAVPTEPVARRRALVDIVARTDAPAHDALAILVRAPSDVGDAAAEAIGSERAAHHIDVLDSALFDPALLPNAARLHRLLEAVEAIKTDTAVALLDRVSKEHALPKLRKDALAARRRLFSFE